MNTRSKNYGRFYGVGAGPGDPELISLKALRVLREVDYIFCPDTGRKSSVQELIDLYGLEAKCHYLEFPMLKNSADNTPYHDAAFAKIRELLLQSYNVAYLSLGDPSLYSTYSPLQKRALEEGFEVETIAGIISPCALAACANRPLVEGREELLIVPALDEERLQNLPDCALALMKVKFHYDALIEELKKQERITDAYLGVRIGMSGEDLLYEPDLQDKPQSYFSSINVRAKDKLRQACKSGIDSQEAKEQ